MARVRFTKYTKPLKLKSPKVKKPKSKLNLSFHARARNLLDNIQDLEWNSLGEIVYQGSVWTGSNINDLLLYHFKKFGKKPVYYAEFVNMIKPWISY